MTDGSGSFNRLSTETSSELSNEPFGMPPSGLAGLLHTPEFFELVRRSNRGPLLRREVTPEQIPAGYDADEVWDALVRIRMAEAFYNPFLIYGKDGSIGREWYLMCASLYESVDKIGALTRRGSELDRIAEERSSSQFVTEQYIREILSNLQHDGYPGSYEGTRSVLLGEREPVTPAEFFALNFHRTMVGLSRYASSPIDLATIRSIYDALCAGVPESERPVIEPSFPVESYGVLGANIPDLDELTLQSACALADRRMTDEALPDIMVSLLVNCIFWRFPPFPRLNNLVGCSVSRLFLYRAGYPVFRYAPKALLYDQWKRGETGDLVRYSFDEAVVRYPGSADFTVLYDSIMSLMLKSIEKMGNDLGTRKRSDDDVIAAIDRVEGLTYRQVDVLKRAVLTPGAEFHIRDHQRKFGVAYSTARIDLVKLAELGFLTEGASGSYHAFYASPQLRTLLLKY